MRLFERAFGILCVFARLEPPKPVLQLFGLRPQGRVVGDPRGRREKASQHSQNHARGRHTRPTVLIDT